MFAPRSYIAQIVPKRGIKTKAKIAVQLLKTWPGLGEQGEIVKVTPGQMRNQLHPNNGASYVLEGTPLKIPLRTREEVLAERELEKKKSLEAQQELEEARPKKGYQDVLSALGIRSETAKTSAPSRLDFLKFPSKKESTEVTDDTTSSGQLFNLQNSIQSLPPIINLQRECQQSGFLKKNITAAEFIKHIYKLTGSDIPSKDVSFIINHESGKVSSPEIDHVGNYEVLFSLSKEITIKRSVSIKSVDITPTSLNRPLSAKIGQPQPEAELEAKSEDSEKEAPTKSAPKFEWENELLVNLQDKREK